MILSGVSIRPEHVQLLAAMAGDELGAKLERAALHHNSIVALTPADRTRIIETIDGSSSTVFGELRTVLVKQVEQQRRKEAKEAQARQSQLGRAQSNHATRLPPGASRDGA